jgi:hypothetical protein
MCLSSFLINIKGRRVARRPDNIIWSDWLILIHYLELDFSTNMHVHWRVRFHNTLNSHFEDVIYLRLFQQINNNIAFTASLCFKKKRRVVIV